MANDLLTRKSHPYAYFRVEEKGGFIGRTISYQLSASVMIESFVPKFTAFQMTDFIAFI